MCGVCTFPPFSPGAPVSLAAKNMYLSLIILSVSLTHCTNEDLDLLPGRRTPAAHCCWEKRQRTDLNDRIYGTDKVSTSSIIIILKK